jgi:hypothetical protein
MPDDNRLRGRRVALSKINIGFGPLWAAEYDEEDGHPTFLAPVLGDWWRRPVALGRNRNEAVANLGQQTAQWVFRS